MTTYGAQCLAVLALAQQQPTFCRQIAPDLPYLYAEVLYALQHEMACTLTDIMVRRMHLIHEEKTQGLTQAPDIAQVMAQELQAEIATQIAAYQREVALTRKFAD